MFHLTYRSEATQDNQSLLSPHPVRSLNTQSGKIGWAILWLLGIPLPVLLVVYLIWGR